MAHRWIVEEWLESDMPIRIFVADDHPIVRDGLIAVLSTQPDFEIVGEAGDGRAVLAAMPTSVPNVLLLDLEMPHMDGVELLASLMAARSAGAGVVRSVSAQSLDRLWRLLALIPSLIGGTIWTIIG